MASIATLIKKLQVDSERNRLIRDGDESVEGECGFSQDVVHAHRALFNPYISKAEKEEVLASWMQRHQPCLFGRIAAATSGIHFCLVDEEVLREKDAAIQEYIQNERLEWKRRSAAPSITKSAPAHGFAVAILSSRVALAEPNNALLELSQRLLELLHCRTTDEPHGMITWEHLYLRDPSSGAYFRFDFSVDFFATAGDRRWWHDHRIPGGLLFTANSAGHMRRYREWYEGMEDQRSWVLETAMDTIARAADTSSGRATWLLDVVDGKPLSDVANPNPDSEKVKRPLQGKDRTRYSGHLHTDHCVRAEFFQLRADKSAEIRRSTWMQDFQYIFDERTKDHLRFIQGVPVSVEEVEGELGAPSEYVRIKVSGRTRRRTKTRDVGMTSDPKQAQLQRALARCREWVLTEEELRELRGS